MTALSLHQRRQRRMAAAVARNHGREVFLRPPVTGALSLVPGQPARRSQATVQYSCTASVSDDQTALAPLTGGMQGARADRLYEVRVETLTTPQGDPPSRGWSLYDPALGTGAAGLQEIVSVEHAADGALLLIATRRSR